jgi:hypothetical protein
MENPLLDQVVDTEVVCGLHHRPGGLFRSPHLGRVIGFAKVRAPVSAFYGNRSLRTLR